MSVPRDRASAQLAAGAGRSVQLDVNGSAMSCDVPADDRAVPSGPTAFGLLAASLCACTAMSARTFLQQWRVGPSAVEVDVEVGGGPTPELHRHVRVAESLPTELREQLAGIVDSTPVTVLLRDSITIVTRLSSSADGR